MLAKTGPYEDPSRHHRSGDKYCPSDVKWLFVVTNSSKSLRTDRGNVGGSGRECNLVRQICIVSSGGTLVNKEHKSKEHVT